MKLTPQELARAQTKIERLKQYKAKYIALKAAYEALVAQLNDVEED